MLVLRTLQKNEMLAGRERGAGCQSGKLPRVMGLGCRTEESCQSSYFHMLRLTGTHSRKAQRGLSFDLDIRQQVLEIIL